MDAAHAASMKATARSTEERTEETKWYDRARIAVANYANALRAQSIANTKQHQDATVQLSHIAQDNIEAYRQYWEKHPTGGKPAQENAAGQSFDPVTHLPVATGQ
jgi:hypothetical protein